MKVAEMPSRSIIAAVLSGNVELGLGPFQKDMVAFETLALYRDSRHLVVSPKHARYEDMMSGDERALKLTPLIASALDNPDMRPSILRLRDQFSTVWEVSSLSLRIHMVEAGHGRHLYRPQTAGGASELRQLSVSWMTCPSVVSTSRWASTTARARTSATAPRNFIALCQRFWNL